MIAGIILTISLQALLSPVQIPPIEPPEELTGDNYTESETITKIITSLWKVEDSIKPEVETSYASNRTSLHIYTPKILDLCLEENPNANINATSTGENMAPGSITTLNFILQNRGNCNINSIILTTDYTENDTLDKNEVSADEFAKELELKGMSFGDTSIKSLISDEEDGRFNFFSMYDLSHSKVDLGKLKAGEKKGLLMEVALNPSVGNEFQGEGISISFKFTAVGA